MTTHTITDADYATALEAGRQATLSEFRAQSVAYSPERDALEVITVRNGGFVVPRHVVGALQHADADDLAKMELWPDGSVIEIEHLDIHVSVDGMLKAALKMLVPAPILAAMFAASGGAAKSPAKAQSARRNGKKGGRPKKHVA